MTIKTIFSFLNKKNKKKMFSKNVKIKSETPKRYIFNCVFTKKEEEEKKEGHPFVQVKVFQCKFLRRF